ncbi:MAG: phenylalanine--tRNA ligase beta subunit-related protein, partial [Oscillospiraceae bacterium]
FDYRYVKGGHIIVRRAEEGEELTTLDGNVRKLTANHLVIADEHRAVGLAGIMGGLNSEIVADTTDVVFESACFDGTCIRKGALSLGMRTEASAKFEKGLDPLNTLPAVNRACELGAAGRRRGGGRRHRHPQLRAPAPHHPHGPGAGERVA